MTALKEYQRLETMALWRPARDEKRIEVVVSLGDTTLLIADVHDHVLAHWSLTAICRQNPGKNPAVFYPRGNPGETIEIDKGQMIDAIAKLQVSIDKATPKPGRLRRWVIGGSVIILVFFGLFVLPNMVRNHAMRIVPAVTVKETGFRLFAQIQKSTGAPCQAPTGVAALETLSQHLTSDGEATTKLVVVPRAVDTTLSLPGNTILINRNLIEHHDNPDILAGYLLAEKARGTQENPMQVILGDAGITGTLKLMATGNLPENTIKRHARHLLSAPPALPKKDLIEIQFHKYDVSPTPFVRSLTNTLPPEYESLSDTGQEKPVISDTNWLRLQTICDE